MMINIVCKVAYIGGGPKNGAEKCCDMSFAANINNACTTEYYIENCKILHKIVKLDSCKDLGVIFGSKVNFSGNT